YALLLGDDSIFNCFFFFQAEDGIRDFHVTGVQTCAFPISARRSTRDSAHGGGVRDDRGGLDRGGRVARPVRGVRERLGGGARRRSEERRVGKERRCRWWSEDYKEEEEG